MTTPQPARPANSYLTTLALAAVFGFAAGLITWGIGVAQPISVSLGDGNPGKVAAEAVGVLLMSGGVLAFLLWATAAAIVAGVRR